VKLAQRQAVIDSFVRRASAPTSSSVPRRSATYARCLKIRPGHLARPDRQCGRDEIPEGAVERNARQGFAWSANGARWNRARSTRSRWPATRR
jgi:hypothetical protein